MSDQINTKIGTERSTSAMKYLRFSYDNVLYVISLNSYFFFISWELHTFIHEFLLTDIRKSYVKKDTSATIDSLISPDNVLYDILSNSYFFM